MVKQIEQLFSDLLLTRAASIWLHLPRMCALRDLIDIGYTFCGTRVVKIFLYLVLPEYLFSSQYRLEHLQGEIYGLQYCQQ